MIVDVHTHLWDHTHRLGPFLSRCIHKRLAQRPWQRMTVAPHALASAAHDVDALIIHGFVSKQLEADIPGSLIASYVAKDPARYIGFAGIDPLADDWRSRFDEARHLKLAGITISPAGQGFHPTHSQAMRLYELCCEHKLPLMIDAASYMVPQANMAFGQPLLLDEIGREFPELRVVLGQTSHPWTNEALCLVGKHEHFYADLSSLAARPWQLYQVLQSAFQQDVIHKLMLGSGFPFSTPAQVIAALYNINGLVRATLMPSIPRQELKNIVQRDVFACLGMPLPDGAGDRPPASIRKHEEEHDQQEQENTSPADALLAQPKVEAAPADASRQREDISKER